ncbi:fatty acid--CoA ligase [Solilutibacter silvestris]|uniref:Acyl-CoA synthetases (AMP-forming)/AMP-acid ligases II n=1 Tax=Solilutibacter silvestris TaxID=1645665 RepID=A0A2K1Q0A2_9GAMM|nr:fatty acid--CoA ligase [Lysobacter silvestris]PNS08470.1 Acyl-CoA synthetases (AMP-forming)/AMP-acid ligases II [Lysobacter silvestris]
MNDHADNAYAFPLLIRHLWNAPLVRSPDQEIIYRDMNRFTYRELRQRVGRLANVLRSVGVGFGDTVAIMDWDSHRYLESFYAVPMMGATLQMVNIRLSPDQILYTLNHAAPGTLIVNSEFLGILDEIRDRLTSIKRFIWISDEGASMPEWPGFEGEYESLLAWESPNFAFHDFDENTRATTFYTTGTTGDPKGVFFSHRQLVLHTLATMAAFCSGADGQRIHRGDVYMPITPMFHVHAWGLPYVALQLGVKQVYPGRYMPEALLALIEKEGVTFSHCVPTLLQMLLTSPKSADVDLRGWKVVIGGSALPVGLARQACERGVDVFGGYGMSETCPVLSIAQLDPHLDLSDKEHELAWRCKAGAPIPLVELRTVDADMQDVPADGQTTGEVVVRSPWLTQGYTGNPAASEKLWEGAYLHTQDVGYFDNGYLKITDRIKDVIKSGGEWVSSLQIEDLLSQHPAVAEVAVIGVRDEKWGERPLAVVVPKAGQALAESDLKAHLLHFVEQGIISKYAVPAHILVASAIEKTSVGKLDKKALRARYAGAPPSS